MLNRLEMLRIFCTAADCGNFKEAAQRLGISPQAVTRAIKELEQLQGELLFHRNTRHSRITAFGAALAADARRKVQEIDALFSQRQAQADSAISGLVRITAPAALGEHHLVPALADLQQQHPALRIDLRLSDEMSDVVDEQIDIGLRVGVMRDSRFIARAVAPVPFYIVGSPALLARCGVPDSLEALTRLPVTVSLDPNTGKPWPWFFAGGQQWHPPTPAFMATDTRAECAAVENGIGLGQLAGFLAIPLLRAGRLQAVLPALQPTPWNLNLYRPQRGPVPARIRLVYDHLLQRFAQSSFFPTTAANWPG
ncbi:regulatory protein, LysR:LysR, substrate-binding precursor [Aquitalea magnusonii]|jgi:DNA-binding transcriptional LysR family regulator|uniref:Regulatory protein, LysR:LysR, substrate-binding n=1 Tax=Aquitalea magnusonii TaxID=332411 RepID=A0A3G9GB60_9NEIS|nr:LysR family transcriptional regulator [Aquitalea magnusonii]BBF85120.1 regulatory protein, LysR:LysR, substrate-binding precursor [Aquitalea magnusonii]